MLSEDLPPKKQMKRAKIQLYRDTPFFGYLVQYLKIIESDRVPTAGITEDTRVFYNPEFVESITEDELKGILAHEVMHKAMEGFKRKGNRQDKKWNVAQDLVINHILANENGFALPEMGMIPDTNGTFEFQDGSTIEDIGDKNFEQVYDLVPKSEVPEDAGFDIHIKMDGDGDEQGQGQAGGAGGDEDGDEDMGVGLGDGEEGEDGDEEGAGLGDKDLDDVDWDSVVTQAAEHAASQGSEPGGLEGLLEVKQEGEIDYKRLISQTISSHVPSDYTFTSPSKRSRAIGEYLPSVTEDEGLDVIVTLDTSGSVSDELLRRFVGEIKNLVDTFENVKMTVIQHDSKVQDVKEYNNAKSSEFERIEIKGRGGTSHVPVFERIEEEMVGNGPTVVIGLTDGYTTVPDMIPNIEEMIWVLNNHAITLDRLKHGQIVRIDPEKET